MTDSRNLLARTMDYLLFNEEHLSKSVIYDHACVEIRVPALHFKYAIRRPNGQLVFRFVDANLANELLYELSALARPLGASVPHGSQTVLSSNASSDEGGDGCAEMAVRPALSYPRSEGLAVSTHTETTADRSLIGRQEAPVG